MSLSDTRFDQLFPVLDAAQVEAAKRFASGPAQTFAPGAVIYDVGVRNAPAWLVLDGTLEIVRRDGLHRQSSIVSLGAGQFSGEVSQLAGRGTLAAGHAGPEGCTALPFDAAHIRALVIGSAELGEMLMRAFILRRVALIQEGGAGSLLIDRGGSPECIRLQGFLARNGYPYTVMDENNGISYWASPIEARLCEGEEVALIGGGNSAGQAVVFLAPKVKRLHLIVRGKGLEASMSRYLIDRIAALPNVELHTGTEIVALAGDGNGLASATFRDRVTGELCTHTLRHLFLFIGADPNAAWLENCVAVDGKGFVVTGDGFGTEDAGRAPLPLETSMPGVFAIGDVRAASVKRVGAAIGEGAAVVAQIHQVLARTRTA